MSNVTDAQTAELQVGDIAAAPEAPPPPPPDDELWLPREPPQGPPAAPAQEPRSLLGTVAIALAIFGVLIASFLMYEFWISGMLQSRSQAALLRQFKASLVLTDTHALVSPHVGSPVGIMEVKSIGLEQVVVQGIGSQQTKQGPGHDPSTPGPGQAGNVVIIGRRTTYGGPFHNLNKVPLGAEITFITRQGEAIYTVESIQSAALGEPSVAEPTTDSRLTLITSDPAYRASHELVLTAKLQGEGLTAPAPLPLRPAGQRPGQSTLMGGWGAVLLWGELLLAAIIGAWYLYRRGFSPAVTYLLTTPVLILLSFLFFSSVDALLPPTL
jgi:sortase A